MFLVRLAVCRPSDKEHEMTGIRGNNDDADDMVLRVLALMRRQARQKSEKIEAIDKARSRCPGFEKIKERAARAIAPLMPADNQSVAPNDMLFAAKRTNAGRQLPEPYLVYFLLVDLLDYKDLGRWEKLAYSIPVDFNGTAYLVLITTQAKRNLSSRSGIGGVRSAT